MSEQKSELGLQPRNRHTWHLGISVPETKTNVANKMHLNLSKTINKTTAVHVHANRYNWLMLWYALSMVQDRIKMEKYFKTFCLPSNMVSARYIDVVNIWNWFHENPSCGSRDMNQNKCYGCKDGQRQFLSSFTGTQYNMYTTVL